jgi:hypothetical protein
MCRLRIMNAMGDKQLTWDPERVDAGDPEALAAVKEAELLLTEYRGRGAQAFRLRPGQPAERVDRLDPTAEETIIIPPVAGG